MGEEKAETLDFVKDFQEYLSQQTQHVNMISGSVSGVKDSEDPGDLGQNGLDHPGVDMSLEDGSSMLVDGFERTYDGKLKCRYCNYATRGTARLIEHIRIHTGEKPHRCHLCPFASAYERHLEAHMRSHTGEKPYKCDLCSFRCSDRSNLSHHRRRRHKILPMKGSRSAPLSHCRPIGALAKRGGAFLYGRKKEAAKNLPASPERNELDTQYVLSQKDCENDLEHNPLNQLSALAGQLSSLPSEAPASPSADSLPEEKPVFLIQPPAPISTSVSCPVSTLTPTPEIRDAAHGGHCSDRTSTPTNSGTNSQPGTPNPAHEPQLLQHCPHCHIYFPDNVLYTIHMGCHGYENPFQCNICGHRCRNKYDFACHFARGQHKQ
ncbi:zinc finger protein Pegasus [Trichomycterus rosablanca]|uniref:zinc finger protein Pegasus n=1 Tax=Trichomycterus rosablanca TaxID=2290929 RepID=UPI002F357415